MEQCGVEYIKQCIQWSSMEYSTESRVYTVEKCAMEYIKQSVYTGAMMYSMLH